MTEKNSVDVFLPQGATLHNGQYRITRVLGSGGFGITYLGFDTILAKPVAIKEYFPGGIVYRHKDNPSVLPYSGEREDFYRYGLEKYVEEARALARFDHHNGVVSVLTFFYENATAYMVMEYLEGETIKQWLGSRNERVLFEEALLTITPVIETLRDLHKSGLIHRDISPDNIMLCKDGTVKLLDFGAARISLGEHSKSLSVILKQGYAPFEQYASKGRQGPWTDVYAVGATLYRMVAGITPPEAPDRIDEDELPALVASLPGLSANLKPVLQKALAIRPTDRYQDMDSFLNALSHASADNTSGVSVNNSDMAGANAHDQMVKPVPQGGEVLWPSQRPVFASANPSADESSIVTVPMSNNAAEPDAGFAWPDKAADYQDNSQPSLSGNGGPAASGGSKTNRQASNKVFAILAVLFLLLVPLAAIQLSKSSGGSTKSTEVKDHIYYRNQGDQAYSAKNYEEAINFYNQAVSMDASDAQAFCGRGNAYKALNNTNQALADYNKAIELDQQLVKAYGARGILYSDQGKTNEALADYSKAIELDSRYSPAYYSRGLLYKAGGNYELALNDFNKLVELSPDYSYAYDVRGNVYSDMKNYSQALIDYNKAIELDPNNAYAYNSRGILYNDTGDRDNAMNDFNKAIEINPNFSNPYTNRGIIYADKGDYDKALADYNKAIDLNPKNAAAYNNRGVVYAKKGNYEQARADFTKASELEPGNSLYIKNRDSL